MYVVSCSVSGLLVAMLAALDEHARLEQRQQSGGFSGKTVFETARFGTVSTRRSLPLRQRPVRNLVLYGLERHEKRYVDPEPHTGGIAVFQRQSNIFSLLKFYVVRFSFGGFLDGVVGIVFLGEEHRRTQHHKLMDVVE